MLVGSYAAQLREPRRVRFNAATANFPAVPYQNSYMNGRDENLAMIDISIT